MTPDDPRHGTPAGYNAGCHEACCKTAIATYARQLRARQYLNGGPLLVDALGIHRRIRALMALGWATTWLDRELGQARTYTGGVLQSATVTAATADRYRRLYDRLSMRLPPMETGPQRQLASRTRNLARRHGWAPPLAWDDIDDPNETPTPSGDEPDPGYDQAVVERVLAGDWRLPSTEAERSEICRRWHASGRSLADLERHTGFKPDRYFHVRDDEAA